MGRKVSSGRRRIERADFIPSIFALVMMTATCLLFAGTSREDWSHAEIDSRVTKRHVFKSLFRYNYSDDDGVCR